MPLSGQKITPSVLSVGITAPAIQTGTVGTPSTGTTEVFDIVLGYYQAVLIAGHTYEAKVLGLVGNCGVADIYDLNIRDSQSSSNPTTSSLLVAQSQWTSTTAGTPSRVPVPLANVFVATVSGTHTFGVSSVRVSGTRA